MATGNFVLDKGYRAATAITKYRAVKYSSAETVTPVTAIADRIAGIAQWAVTAAELARGKGTDVRMIGISEAEAASAIALGAEVGLAADGRVKTAAIGERIIGRCVGHPATAAGDRISLLVNTMGPLAP
jgi:D-arabinose 1-dehydrogenase-like Zn-dependent alcohol dehydrogenase